MLAPRDDAPVKTMTEYHQRYSKGRLISLGWEAYCRDCGRGIKLHTITRQAVRQQLLSIGWRPEKIKGYDLEQWICPSCLPTFGYQEAIDASTTD